MRVLYIPIGTRHPSLSGPVYLETRAKFILPSLFISFFDRIFVDSYLIFTFASYEAGGFGISFVLFCSCDRVSLESATARWLHGHVALSDALCFQLAYIPGRTWGGACSFLFRFGQTYGDESNPVLLFTLSSFSFFLYLLFTWTVAMVGLHVRGG